jgi:hypothetical protein
VCDFAIVAVADTPARFRRNLQSPPHCGHPVLHAKFADHYHSESNAANLQ